MDIVTHAHGQNSLYKGWSYPSSPCNGYASSSTRAGPQYSSSVVDAKRFPTSESKSRFSLLFDMLKVKT